MEESREDRTLHGLKQVAAHLGVSENTVRRYFREEGLPLVRIGSSLRPRYRGSVREIDRWLGARRVGGAEEVALTDDPTEPVGDHPTSWRGSRVQTSWMVRVALLSLTLLALLAGVVGWAVRSAETAEISRVRLDADSRSLVALDDQDRELLRVSGPWGAFTSGESSKRGPATLVIDVDGDGSNEILFDHRPVDPATTSGALYCIDRSGTVRWRFEHGRSWPNDPRIGPFFGRASMQLVTVATGRRLLLVVSSHYHFYADRIVLLDPRDGSLVSEYLHPGRISAVEIGDVDADGEAELLLGGMNNPFAGLGQPVVAILELPFVRRTEIGNAANYVDPTNTMEKVYIVLPRADAFDARYESTRVFDITLREDVLIVQTGGSSSAYRMTLGHPDFEPRCVSVTDPYRRAHRELFLRGVLDHDLTAEETVRQARILVLPTAPFGNAPEFDEKFWLDGGPDGEVRSLRETEAPCS